MPHGIRKRRARPGGSGPRAGTKDVRASRVRCEPDESLRSASAVTAADQPFANASAKQFLRNALSSYANLILGVILSLVLTRVLLRNLGAGTYGLWIVLLSIVGYIALLDVGVSTAVVQRIARMTAVGDHDGLADVIRTASVFFTLSGAVAVLITVVLAPLLASIVNLGSISTQVAGVTLVLLGAMLAVKFVATVPGAVLFGVGRSDRSSQFGLAAMLITQLAEVAVVLAGGGLIGLGIVVLLGTGFSFVMSSFLVRRITGFSVRSGRFRRAILVDLLKFGSRNTVIAISGTVSYSLDALIIGIILPVAQVAPYDIALSTANLTRNLTTYGGDLLLPTYAHFDSVNDSQQQARLFSRTVMATLAISLPILVALSAFGEPILKLWLGQVPPKTYSIMIALGFVTALELPGHQCFIFLTGVGRNQLMVRMALLAAGVNLAGSIVATFWLGPIGPAIGSLPAVLVIEFTVLPIIVCRYLKIPVSRYVKDALAPVVPAVLVAGVLALAMLWLVPPQPGASTLRDGTRGLICAAVVVAAAWAVMLAVLLRIEPDIRATAMAKIRPLSPAARRARRTSSSADAALLPDAGPGLDGLELLTLADMTDPLQSILPFSGEVGRFAVGEVPRAGGAASQTQPVGDQPEGGLPAGGVGIVSTPGMVSTTDIASTTGVVAADVHSDRSRAVPTWFGPEDRPLFGWVHIPDHPRGPGVVLCPSIGLEGEASQLAYRILARGLADAGCTVLRFDYHGTGDSTGSLTDPDLLDAWMDDVAEGLAYVRAAGATTTHLVGARLGATIASRAASDVGAVDSLTLWYPWTKGSQFLRYQRALRRMYAVSDSPDLTDGSTEIPGFVLDPALTADLKALDSSRPEVVLAASVLVIDAADPGTGEVARPEFGPDGCMRRSGTGVDALFGVELMRATVSDADIEAIRSFILGTQRGMGTGGEQTMGEEAAEEPVVITPTIRSIARVERPGGVPVTERPVFFGPAGLFGMLAEPTDPSSGASLLAADRRRVRTTGGPVPEFGTALFLNAGSLHHVGPGRQWVELSRTWAASGVRCLRMDIGSVGDSPVTGPAGDLSSYPQHAEADVLEGVRFLSPGNPRDVLLLGLCAGAYHSLLAATSAGVGGVAILNPLRVPSANRTPGSMGDAIDGAPDTTWATTGEETPAAPAPAPAPETHRHRFLGSLRDRGVFQPLTKHVPDRVWWLARIGKGGTDPVGAFQRVVDSGAALCVILGPDEWPGIGRGRVHELHRVARSGVFSITLVPTLDHSFHVATGRVGALVVLDEWVLGTGPTGATTPPESLTIS